MNNTVEQLKEKIELFRNNLNDYKNKNYDEYNTRADFIDSSFSALGWDMYNEQGVIEQFREVVREDKVEIEGKKKSPDYSFRIGQQIIFYVEAKKPSVDIKNDPEPAYQLRRYAYTQGLKLSILTDFEEIAVYDTRIKPEPKDSAGIARMFYCTYDELFEKSKVESYETNFEFLLNTFGKQAVLTGSFNQYAEKNKNKKGTEAVDKGFLNLLNTWRESLAVNIALKNEDLDEYNLNIAVQKIIDRLIFLRITEDRLIEKPNLLHEIASGNNIFNKLFKIFEEADRKYNSSLFVSEEWLKNLIIEDKALKAIIDEMYYPKCPYEFSVLPLEILGQAYEQFLGKTIKYIRKTKYGHKVEIEEKPEVRKAGGVYYTPQYIVNYIVENTVGEKIKGRKPEEIKKIRILDPACGSGSFLIGAYDYLSRYHLEYYLKNETQKKKALKEGIIYQTGENRYKLSTEIKSKILVNNIFGVDIDHQAVEVTKLSLLLKVLEDENLEYKEQLFKAEQHNLLPDLSNNIKCGNSLIGSDFYEDKNLSLFDEKDMRKINTFDWDKEFDEIFKNSGFDCVIGNPPYVRQELLGEHKNYFKQKYQVYNGTADLYAYFIEKGISLLKPTGYFSYIVANKWLRTNYGQPLRNWMKQQRILELVDFGDLQVFKEATTYPCILTIEKNNPEKQFKVAEIKNLEFANLKGYVEGKIYRGILTGLDKAFVIDESKKNEIIDECPECADFIKPYLAGKDVQRYENPKINNYIIFLRRGFDLDKYPVIKNYLELYKKELMPGPKKYSGKKWSGRKPGNYKWYEIQDTVDYFKEFNKPKVLYLKFQVKPQFTYDEEGFYANSAVWFIPKPDKYLLALLNSKIGWFLISKYCTRIQNGYQLIFKYLGEIPIKKIDFDRNSEKAKYDEIFSLVDQMLETQKTLHDAKTGNDKKLYQQKADILDKQIDNLFYELYGLTDEEIKIVEDN